jgi:hypothetical protein
VLRSRRSRGHGALIGGENRSLRPPNPPRRRTRSDAGSAQVADRVRTQTTPDAPLAALPVESDPSSFGTRMPPPPPPPDAPGPAEPVEACVAGSTGSGGSIRAPPRRPGRASEIPPETAPAPPPPEGTAARTAARRTPGRSRPPLLHECDGSADGQLVAVGADSGDDPIADTGDHGDVAERLPRGRVREVQLDLRHARDLEGIPEREAVVGQRTGVDDDRVSRIGAGDRGVDGDDEAALVLTLDVGERGAEGLGGRGGSGDEFVQRRGALDGRVAVAEHRDVRAAEEHDAKHRRGHLLSDRTLASRSHGGPKRLGRFTRSP